jgi:hypothetical protein
MSSVKQPESANRFVQRSAMRTCLISFLTIAEYVHRVELVPSPQSPAISMSSNRLRRDHTTPRQRFVIHSQYAHDNSSIRCDQCLPLPGGQFPAQSGITYHDSQHFIAKNEIDRSLIYKVPVRRIEEDTGMSLA